MKPTHKHKSSSFFHFEYNLTGISIIVFFLVSFLFPPHSPAREVIHGIPGTSTERAVVNFTELARQEALSPAVLDKPKTVHPFMPIPENLPVPEESIIAPSLSWEEFDAMMDRQAPTPLVASPSPSSSFSALGDNGTSIPPDTHGAVGPNHLMVTLNTQVRIQDRSGTTISTVSLDNFWSSLGSPDAFDPKVLYDHLSDRWIFTACADARLSTSSQLIGVSQTNDPTGFWNLFKVNSDGVNWLDFPSMGYNKDWIVVSLNLFSNAVDAFIGTNIYVFKKSDLYDTVSPAGTNTLIQTSSLGGTHVPAVTYDSSLSVIYLLSRWSSSAGTLRLYQISGSVGSETFSPIGFVTSAENWGTSVANNFSPQLGSATGIMANDPRLQNVVYRNGTLWTVHHIFLPTASPTRTSVQWWQISTSGSVLQRGRIDDSGDTNSYAFPSIAVNKNDDVLIGYSRFSSSQYASANYSFRFSTDTSSTLRDDTVLKAGEDIYIKVFSGSRVRWGDYSNTVVDPVNDTDMWTIQEYAETDVGAGQTNDRWGTWWGKIEPVAPVIPTLTEWAMLIFAMLLLSTGIWFIVLGRDRKVR